MITFKEVYNNFTGRESVIVVQDGKRIGNIRGGIKKGFGFFPKGVKTGVKFYKSIWDCKDSLIKR